jgi:hypothetical protein
MRKIEVPILDQDLQERFESWLSKRGNLFEREIHNLIIYVSDEQDAFWIGYAFNKRLFDGLINNTVG